MSVGWAQSITLCIPRISKQTKERNDANNSVHNKEQRKYYSL